MASSDPSTISQKGRDGFTDGYNSGLPISKLASDFGLTVKGARKLIDDLDLPKRTLRRTARSRRNVDGETELLIEASYKDGSSIGAIQERTELPLSQIYRVLAEKGVELRRKLPKGVDAVDERTRAEIVNMHSHDRTAAKVISERLGLTLNQVRSVLRQHPRNKPQTNLLEGVNADRMKYEIQKTYLEGNSTIQAIAEAFGVSSSSVVRIIRNAEISKRGKGGGLRSTSESVLKRLPELHLRYENGVPIKQLATEVGIGEATLRQRFKRHFSSK